MFKGSLAGPGATFKRLCLGAVVASVCQAALPDRAMAATFDLFLISEHSAPTSGGVVTTETVHQLGGFNLKQSAGSATLVEDFSFNNGATPSIVSYDPGFFTTTKIQPTVMDQGETGPVNISYLQSEVSSWDNVNLPGTTVDPEDQIDVARNTFVTFDLGAGITDFIVAELGGLNPFQLLHCADAFCQTSTRLFNTLQNSALNALLADDAFSLSDTGEAVDQTWLFRFDMPLTGFLRIVELDDRAVYTNARLQLDYVGAVASSAPPSEVPIPGSLPLMAAGVGLLAFMRRGKRV